MTHIQRAAVAEALTWVGTPYCHQASTKGVGTDCLGLLRGVWRGVIGPEPRAVPAYSQDWSEPQSDEVLMRMAALYLNRKPIAQMQAGDVLLFRMRAQSVAKHLGIVTATGAITRFTHAYSGHGVVESTLTKPWLRRVAACFEFPEGT